MNHAELNAAMTGLTLVDFSVSPTKMVFKLEGNVESEITWERLTDDTGWHVKVQGLTDELIDHLGLGEEDLEEMGDAFEFDVTDAEVAAEAPAVANWGAAAQPTRGHVKKAPKFADPEVERLYYERHPEAREAAAQGPAPTRKRKVFADPETERVYRMRRPEEFAHEPPAPDAPQVAPCPAEGTPINTQGEP